MRVAVRARLDLVVEDEHESATSASDDVGESALEEGTGTFVLKDLVEAINGASVHDICSTRLHHKSSSDCVKRVRGNTSRDSDELSERPHSEEVGLLVVGPEQDFAGVKHAEIRGSVCDDTDDGDCEPSIKPDGSV